MERKREEENSKNKVDEGKRKKEGRGGKAEDLLKTGKGKVEK